MNLECFKTIADSLNRNKRSKRTLKEFWKKRIRKTFL